MDGCVLHIAEKFLTEEIVKGKAILDVGSYNVNGTLHSVVDKFYPSEYVGVDIEIGQDVDIVMDGKDVYDKFGEHFDIVLCASCLEHCQDWKSVWISMIKSLKIKGYIYISVPGITFPYHDYRGDYHRWDPKLLAFTAFQSGIKILYCEWDHDLHHNVHLWGQRCTEEILDLPEAQKVQQPIQS